MQQIKGIAVDLALSFTPRTRIRCLAFDTAQVLRVDISCLVVNRVRISLWENILELIRIDSHRTGNGTHQETGSEICDDLSFAFHCISPSIFAHSAMGMGLIMKSLVSGTSSIRFTILIRFNQSFRRYMYRATGGTTIEGR